MCPCLNVQVYSLVSTTICCKFLFCTYLSIYLLKNHKQSFFMAALWNRPFYFCPVVSSSFFYLLFFFAYSQPSQIGCLPYFHTWCGLSANLGCRSETCYRRLAENTGRKIRHLGTIAQLCRAISSQLRHVSTIGKKVN